MYAGGSAASSAHGPAIGPAVTRDSYVRRSMSFGIGGNARFSPPAEDRIGHGPASQMQSWMRRRLEDAVEDVFRAAMQRGDLAAAEDLLGVMENMHARAKVRYQAERRGAAVTIERGWKELEARKARRRLGPG
jgi:hypothetical protein